VQNQTADDNDTDYAFGFSYGSPIDFKRLQLDLSFKY